MMQGKSHLHANISSPFQSQLIIGKSKSIYGASDLHELRTKTTLIVKGV
jgi:hypothetical protein